MKILHTYLPDVSASLRQSEWHEVEEVAREVPGWVAFRPGDDLDITLLPAPPSIQPQPESVVLQKLAPALSPVPPDQGSAPVTALLVADRPAKQESLARTALPFFAVVIGFPLLLWYMDKKKEAR